MTMPIVLPPNPTLLLRFKTYRFIVRSCHAGTLRSSEGEVALKRRRYAPVLESALMQKICSGGKNLEFINNEWQSVPDIWKSNAENFGDRVAVVDPYHDPPSELTYKQLEQEILDFSEGLRNIGFLPEEKVALFADNSSRWLVADQGIMSMGAINVVRGTRSSDQELFQIYEHSESTSLVIDSPEFFNRIAESFLQRADIHAVILLWGEKLHVKESYSVKYNLNIPIYEFKEIIDLGRKSRQDLLESSNKDLDIVCDTINPDDIATLIYTSGTSGSPKGVMLTHQNLLHQIKNLWEIVPAVAGDRFLSMLPPWHAYERACEYFIFTHGIEQVYTNVKRLKDDLKLYQPHYLISVPLVYQTLYSSIKKQISSSSAARKLIALTFIKISLLYMDAKRIHEGTVLTEKSSQQSSVFHPLDWAWARTVAAILWPLHNLANKLIYEKIRSAIGISKAGISGGGSLPGHIDKFFEAICVKALGTIGHPLNETEIKVVDMETGEGLRDGSKGIVKIRGPQVMKGYYKNPLATSDAIDKEGWFNTGDIGYVVPKHSVGRHRKCGGMIALEGRAKDTIVLSTGENVEPSVLEEAAMRSSLIQQIVVVGQDERRVGALIVSDRDEVIKEGRRQSVLDSNAVELSKENMKKLIYGELRKWTCDCSFRIGPILILDEPFTIDNGLMTPTMKIRRDMVTSRYKQQIADLYK